VATPAFIDAAYAADSLHVPLDTILDLVQQGRLRTYGGRASNPFLRSAEVSALAAELGLGVTQEAESPRRVKSPSSRVQQRITADARWGDISEDDIRDWATRADRHRLEAARKAAGVATERLRVLLEILDDTAP
jgi:hypothetical protein